MPHIGDMDDVIPTIVIRLREARLDAELSQREVADLLGCSRWTYNRVEMGHQPFDENWLYLLPLAMRKPLAAYLQEEHLRQAKAMGRVIRTPLTKRHAPKRHVLSRKPPSEPPPPRIKRPTREGNPVPRLTRPTA